MEISEYKNILKIESYHFFYIAHHQLVLNLIKKYIKKSTLNILDAGCGTGLFSKKLETFGNVTGVDISSYSVKLAKRRRVRVKKASIVKLPFPDSSFDLVVCIDVLYHLKVESDLKALQEFSRVLKPNGILILRVPAYNWLRRSYDKQVHTRERYNLSNLRKKLIKAGFKPKKLSYINSVLFIGALIEFLIEKVVQSNKPASPLIKLPKLLNYLMTLVMLMENNLINYINLPFGLGIISVCKNSNKKVQLP